MKILITGGAGFIGSAVVRRAIADGHRRPRTLGYAGHRITPPGALMPAKVACGSAGDYKSLRRAGLPRPLQPGPVRAWSPDVRSLRAMVRP